MKNIIKKILAIIFFIYVLFTFTGCAQQEPNLSEKSKSEIEYLSTKLINIANQLNNITFENYKVTSQKVELSKDSADNEKSSESSSSQEGGDSETESSKKDGANNIIASEMSPNTILNPISTDVDWPKLKNEIENIYYSWNTVILDLNQLNVNSSDILGFSTDLDKATGYIKNGDKANSLLAVANLYGYLPKYAELAANEEQHKNVIKTKSHILNAYALEEAGDWGGTKEEISKANEIFKQVITDAIFLSKNSYRANKSYVLINELNNSLNSKDREIFLIQYRNLMEEISQL